MIYVLYHRDKDGQGAAYSAWKKFGDKAKYISVQYGENIPLMPGATEVYIVDFSYSREILNELGDNVEKVVVLDHHKTAQKELEQLCHPKVDVHYDMTKSGAMIAWEYFVGTSAPDLIKYIQDRDLWLFKLDNSIAVHEFLCSFSYSPALWDFFVTGLSIDHIVAEGKVILRARDKAVKSICRNAFDWTDPDGHKVKKVNSSLYQSEVGHYLLDKYPDIDYACIFSNVDGEKIVHSLRSRGEFDVSAIAKKNGGGGHKNAAGYQQILPSVQ